jgi:hypothetical protein
VCKSQERNAYLDEAARSGYQRAEEIVRVSLKGRLFRAVNVELFTVQDESGERATAAKLRTYLHTAKPKCHLQVHAYIRSLCRDCSVERGPRPPAPAKPLHGRGDDAHLLRWHTCPPLSLTEGTATPSGRVNLYHSI